MKKIFTLLFAILFISIQAQDKFDLLYSEGFDGGTLPAGWELHDLDGLTPSPNVGAISEAWTVLNRGGGNFGMFSTSWYVPAGTSDDWVTTTAIDLSGVTADDYELTTLTFSALAFSSQFAEGYEVYINTVGQALENFTPETRVLQVAAENTEETIRSIDLADFLGQSIYVAFRNNSVDKWAMMIDNIAVYGISGYGASVDNADYRVYNEMGSTTVAISGTNLGSTPAQNVAVEYSIDGGSPTSQTIAVGNVSTLGDIVFSVDIPLSEAGVRDISLAMTHVNGNELNNPSALSFKASVIAEENMTPRRALIETFTSSTCGPCLPGNQTLHGILDNLSANDDPVIIKFQQDFPGDGDGYATVESIARRGFYGINSIPNTNINGQDFDNNTNALVASNITTADNRTAFFDIDAEYFVNPNTKRVYVKGSYTPLTAVLENTRLMIAIQENETTQNVASNGETEFLDVFKKFIPGADGITIPGGSAIGTSVEFEYSYEFQGEYRDPLNSDNMINHEIEHSVEEFEDLAISLWIESTDDNNVLNAASAVESQSVAVEDIANINDLTIFPNPVSSTLNIVVDGAQSDVANFSVLDVHGKLVMSLRSQNFLKGKQEFNFNVSDLPTGVHYLRTENSQGAVFTPFVKI